MKTQNSVQNPTQPTKDPVQVSITTKSPTQNPLLSEIRSKNHNTLPQSSKKSKNSSIFMKIIDFTKITIKKLLYNLLFSGFLIILSIINVITLTLNITTISDNKKLTLDNLAIYEMIEVSNIMRKADSRKIKYLESVINENNIYLSPMYKVYINEEVQEEYQTTIETFNRIDYNAMLDQFLYEDYNTMSYKERMKELETREKIKGN